MFFHVLSFELVTKRIFQDFFQKMWT